MFRKFFLFKDLFKDLFYFILIGKAGIQRGETERKIFRPMIHSPSERNCGCYASVKPKPGASSRSPTWVRGCRIPKLWAVLHCFPGPQAGSWKGSRAARIEPAAIGIPGVQGEDLNHCATAPGPRIYFFIL